MRIKRRCFFFTPPLSCAYFYFVNNENIWPHNVLKLHSHIRTPWNSNNDQDLSTWIGEQPCMQMNLGHFSRNADIHIIPGKLSKINVHAWLFSNPRGKVLFLFKSMGQICPLALIIIRICPHGLENNHAWKWFTDNFPEIIHIYALLENCQKSICMHRCLPIYVERS